MMINDSLLMKVKIKVKINYQKYILCGVLAILIEPKTNTKRRL